MKGLYSINLINSMRVDRAEIATRGNVMLIGDNDAGKTAALRLWIYFITANRDTLGLDINQDFADFYFPRKNSYIIYELFNDEQRSMIILKASNKVIYTHFVDLPYQRDYFFDEDNRAFERWEDIADKIGPKANDFAEIRGEDNLRKILYGIYDGPKASDYRRFSLVRTKNAEGLRRAVQGVFLNRDLVETRTIRDFILRSLNLYDAKVSITGLKNLIQPVKEQYNDILLWNEQSEDEEQIKLREAKAIVELYERKVDTDSAIAMNIAKLNFIPIRNQKLLAAIAEVVKLRIKERDELEDQIKQKEAEYPSLLENYTRPVHNLQTQLDKLEEQYKYYQDKDRKNIISIFNDEAIILTTLQKLTEEYNLLTATTGSIDERYNKMLESVLAPMIELCDRWNAQIKATAEKQEKERLQLQIDYQSACKNIQQTHSETVSRLSSSIRMKDEEIISLNGQLLSVEKENMFAERKGQIEVESRKHEKNIPQLTSEISALQQRLTETRTASEKEVTSLKAGMCAKWRQSEESLSIRQKALSKRLEEIDGSFLNFLENNKPGWQNTIGRIASEELLFSQDLLPEVVTGDENFYGVKIDLSKEKNIPVSIDSLQKELIEIEKELRKVRMFLDNPNIALQSDIQRIEEGYSKKVVTITKELKTKQKILDDDNNQLKRLHDELDNLMKRERVAKATKSRQLQEKINILYQEKSSLDDALSEENGENGFIKRLTDAETARDIRIKELERYSKEIQTLQENLKAQDASIQAERQRISDMKARELAEQGIDAGRISKLQKEIEAYTVKKTVLDLRDNIILYGNYKRFIDEYTSKETLQNQLAVAKRNKNAFIEEYNREKKSKNDTLTSLRNEIQRETGRQSSLSEELKIARNNVYGDERSFDIPSYLLTSEIIESEEKAADLIDAVSKLLQKRREDLDLLHVNITAFVEPFSLNNVYKFRKLFSLNDKNYTDYCDFAQWLKDFIKNETWKEDERVSYIHFNDIIKEAGHEYRETEDNMTRVDNIVTKINRDLRHLGFSKINFIEFKTRDSGNPIFNVLKEISTFYKENSDAIENDKMGIFALEIPEADLDVLRKKAMELIFKLSTELSANTAPEISLKDTFEMMVQGKENDNSIPWTMSFTNFGSKGTSFVARTLINIVLIDVFKNNLESPQDFVIHCVMDEIGQLDTGNRKGILSFARDRNIYLVQAAPETMDGSDYTFVYYIETQNGKCRITKLIDA